MSRKARRASIGGRLTLSILAAAFATALAVSSFHASHAFREGRRRVESELERMAGVYGPAAEEALWTLDHEVLDALMEGMGRSPVVAWAAIRDDKGTLIETGPRPATALAERRVSLEHGLRGGTLRIGELILLGSGEEARRDALAALALELPLSLGALLTLSLFMLAFLARDLARPLKAAALRIGTFDPDRAWKPAGTGRGRGDELDLLVEAFDNLAVRLVASYAERRRAEASLESALREREVLIRELFHRTKNNMQVLLSLLSLERERVGEPRALEAFSALEGRILSMSLVHKLLYESSDLAALDLARYLVLRCDQAREALEPGLPPPGLDFAVESLVAPVDIAIPFSLASGELIDNAFRHAFPGGRAGRIALRLARTGDTKAELVVEDDGIGWTPTREGGKGLGIGLARTLIEDQLHGSLAFSPAARGGLRCEASFDFGHYERRI